MFNLMKNKLRYSCCILVVVATCSFSGCSTDPLYHDGCSKEWIMEQLQQGNLTQEEADQLLAQEECDE